MTVVLLVFVLVVFSGMSVSWYIVVQYNFYDVKQNGWSGEVLIMNCIWNWDLDILL